VIDGMLAIDDHCHLGEPKVERAGVRRFLAEDLLARMDRTGIDKAVVCHLIFPLWEQEEFTQGNNWSSRRPASTRTGWWACA
jgi:hypothetical protein